MATAKTLLTIEDLAHLPDDGYHRYELLDGELISMAPAGGEHGGSVTRWAAQLWMHVDSRQLGMVLTGDVGIILRRNPDRVRAPDVCFIARDRLPPGGISRSFLEIVPDLIIEVVSPGDTASEVQQETEEWLSAGARLVWNAYPDTRSVMAFRSLDQVRVYSANDTLDGSPVLPQFTCLVADLFG
jgi:Uma2 family endonuclease